MSQPVQTRSRLSRSRSSSASGGTAVDAANAWKLNAIACQVGNLLEVDACSIYRLDPLRRTLALADTVGLRREGIGRICLDVGEGLPGLVVEQRRTLHIPESAASHPRFRLLSEVGEEPYESFLGVPIYQRGAAAGVLAVQNTEPRRFPCKDVSWLESVGRQLGTLLTLMPVCATSTDDLPALRQAARA